MFKNFNCLKSTLSLYLSIAIKENNQLKLISYNKGNAMLNLNFKMIFGILLIFVLSTTLSSQTIIRVNCGGDEYWASGGEQWYADQPYSPGSWGYENPGYFLFYDYPISGTNDDPLYQYEHNALDNYKFTVPSGTYVVTLKFADLYYDNVGDRVFHVEIEGDRVLHNFDILAEVGFAEALDKTFQVDVSDGILDIQFITIEVEPGVTLAHANIKAIGVVEQGTHEPKLWVNPHELDFYDYSFRQYFEVKNGGEQPLEWSCFEDPDETWITAVSPTSGMLYQGQSQRIEVQVTRTDLDDGQYEGKIAITSNGGDNSVKILMEVVSEVPIVEVAPTTLSYGSILTKRVFKIKNVGTAQLDWTAENKNNDPWFTKISPTNGQLDPGYSHEVIVTINRNGLTDTTYQGTVAVETNGGDEEVDLFVDTYNKPLSINCGGYEYVDKNDHSWFYDLGFEGGQTSQCDENINNTDDDQLYQNARIGMTKYQFAVQKNGFYKISLHFTEFQHSAAGERIFDVQIEDNLFLEDFDIYAENGSYFAVVHEANIEVTDNLLDISFIPKVGAPCISASEIHQIPLLKVKSTSLNFGSILTKRKFSVINVGTIDLIWSAKDQNNEPWLIEISPTGGLLAPSDTQLVTVTIDRLELVDSLYQGNITVETDGGNQNVSLVFETKNKPLRINCGGSEYVDNNDNRWFNDILFIGGNLNSCQDSIANTVDDQLYQTARSGMTRYEFPVQNNGLYKITLHFAEFHHNAVGQRIFDVQIEDSLVLENLDIYNEVGSYFAVMKSANIEVNDNQLDISFMSKTSEPCICAIEIFLNPILAIEPISLNFGSILTKRTFSVINAGPVDLNWSAVDPNDETWLVEISPISGVLVPSDTQLVTVTIDRQELADSMMYQGFITVETDGGNQDVSLAFETTNEPLRINCGGAEYVDANENLWFNDILFIGGNLNSCQDSIANTVDDLLYQTARSGMTKYEFSIQDYGLYKITLHFAEFQHNAAGERIFDVQIEDSLVLTDFDIYAEHGSFFAVIKEAEVKMDDNQLDIVFVSKTGEPCIAAIEICQIPELPTDIGHVDDQQLIPECFELKQNFPNPFNMETSIAYQLPVPAHVTLEIYNLLGQKQKTLVNKGMSAGFHSINWDGKNLNGTPVTSGFYIYQIQVTPKDGHSTSFHQIRKMLLLK